VGEPYWKTVATRGNFLGVAIDKIKLQSSSLNLARQQFVGSIQAKSKIVVQYQTRTPEIHVRLAPFSNRPSVGGQKRVPNHY